MAFKLQSNPYDKEDFLDSKLMQRALTRRYWIRDKQINTIYLFKFFPSQIRDYIAFKLAKKDIEVIARKYFDESKLF